MLHYIAAYLYTEEPKYKKAQNKFKENRMKIFQSCVSFRGGLRIENGRT